MLYFCSFTDTRLHPKDNLVHSICQQQLTLEQCLFMDSLIENHVCLWVCLLCLFLVFRSSTNIINLTTSYNCKSSVNIQNASGIGLQLNKNGDFKKLKRKRKMMYDKHI